MRGEVVVNDKDIKRIEAHLRRTFANDKLQLLELRKCPGYYWCCQ